MSNESLEGLLAASEARVKDCRDELIRRYFEDAIKDTLLRNAAEAIGRFIRNEGWKQSDADLRESINDHLYQGLK